MVGGGRGDDGIECVSGGAVGTGEFAERGGDDAERVGGNLPLELVHEIAEGLEQGIAASGDAAPDDDDFGVEHVGEGSDGGGEGTDRPLPVEGGCGMVGFDRAHQVVGGGEQAVGALGEVVVADGVFEAAGDAGDIQGSVRVEGDVAEVAGFAVVTAEQVTIDHGGATDTGAEGEEEDISGVARGPAPDLAEQGGVSVVEHGDAGALEVVGPIEADESLEAARHEADEAAVGRGEARCGEPDAVSGAAELGFELAYGVTDGFGEGEGDGEVERGVGGGEGSAGLVEGDSFGAGAAEVDADEQLVHEGGVGVVGVSGSGGRVLAFADTPAGVDGEHVAGDGGGGIAEEEQGGLGDLVGFDEVAEERLFGLEEVVDARVLLGALAHGGADQSRGDDVDADAFGGVVGGHGAAEADDGGFAGGVGVGGEVVRGWGPGENAGHVEQGTAQGVGAARLGEHVSEQRTAEEEHSPGVRVHDGIPAFRGALVGGTIPESAAADTGDVEGGVDSAEGLDGGADDEVGAEGVGEVGLDEVAVGAVSAEPVAEFLAMGGGSTDEAKGDTGGGGAFGGGGGDTGGAGDQPGRLAVGGRRATHLEVGCCRSGGWVGQRSPGGEAGGGLNIGWTVRVHWTGSKPRESRIGPGGGWRESRFPLPPASKGLQP